MAYSNHKIRQDPPEDLSARKDQSKVGYKRYLTRDLESFALQQGEW